MGQSKVLFLPRQEMGEAVGGQADTSLGRGLEGCFANDRLLGLQFGERCKVNLTQHDSLIGREAP